MSRLIGYLSFICLLIATCSLYAQDIEFGEAITAQERVKDAHYGQVISMSGDYALVGTHEKQNYVDDVPITNYKGEVEVLKFDSITGKWVHVQTLRTDSSQKSNDFGLAVHLSDSFAFVGAPGYFHENGSGTQDAGAVYFYKINSSGTWDLIQVILPDRHAPFTDFGSSIARHGKYLAVGAPGNDTSRVDGSRNLNSGLVHVYELVGNSWIHKDVISSKVEKASEFFGFSVTINGNRLAVGVTGNGTGMNENGNYANLGSVEVYRIDSDSVRFQYKQIPGGFGNNHYYGYSLASTKDYLLVGSRTPNATLMAWDGTVLDYLTISGTGTERKAMAVDIKGDYIIIGSPDAKTGVGSIVYEGKACIFKYFEDEWNLFYNLRSLEYGNSKKFGSAVGIGEGHFLVGGWDADRDSINSIVFDAGAIYTYHFVACESDYSTSSLTACGSVLSPSGNYTWTESGDYKDTSYYLNGCFHSWDVEVTIKRQYYYLYDTITCDEFVFPDGTVPQIGSSFDRTFYFTTKEGCDSTLRFRGQKLVVNTSIYLEDGVLRADQADLEYQWLNCFDGFEPIEGENGQTFTPTEEGFYALSVKRSVCWDTTTCIYVDNSQLVNPKELVIRLDYDPENNMGILNISEAQRFVEIELYTIQGAILTRQLHNDITTLAFELPETKGIYILVVQVSDLEEPQTLKIINY